jgi:hypothetical protein
MKGLSSKSAYTANDNRANLFFMIFCDIQLLIGLVLFFTNGWFTKVQEGMGAVMKNNTARFFTVEHAAIMILAWILVHIGRSVVKKTIADQGKHRKALLFFGLALLLILISIPWPFRAEIARPLFRGFN